jgi:diacylglycerol kinase
MKNKPFSLSARWSSFRNAFHGLQLFARHETHGKIQFILAFIALILGGVCNISRFEWLALLISIVVVLTLEIINSTIERICDLYSRNFTPLIKEIKDLAASAVLIASIVAAINGILIFVPKILAEIYTHELS